MRRFSILLSGAACVVLAASAVQAAPINTTRSNIKRPSIVVGAPACTPKNTKDPKNVPTGKVGDGTSTDTKGDGTPGAMDDCNSTMQGVSTTR